MITSRSATTKPAKKTLSLLQEETLVLIHSLPLPPTKNRPRFFAERRSRLTEIIVI